MRQAHQFQQRLHALADFSARRTSQFQRQSHVVKHRTRGQQIEVLEHHPNLAPCRAQLHFGQRGHIASGHPNFPSGWTIQKIDHPHQRAFTSARSSNDAEHFTGSDVQVDATQSLYRALRARVNLCDAAKIDHGAKQKGLQQ